MFVAGPSMNKLLLGRVTCTVLCGGYRSHSLINLVAPRNTNMISPAWFKYRSVSKWQVLQACHCCRSLVAPVWRPSHRAPRRRRRGRAQPRGARRSGGEGGAGADEAGEDGVDDTEVAVGVLLTGFLDGVYHRRVAEMALAALEARLDISVVDTYHPTHHNPFCF